MPLPGGGCETRSTRKARLNAVFVFSPLAAHGVQRDAEVLATLNAIPPGYIDAFGLNVYSRPMSTLAGRTLKADIDHF